MKAVRELRAPQSGRYSRNRKRLRSGEVSDPSNLHGRRLSVPRLRPCLPPGLMVRADYLREARLAAEGQSPPALFEGPDNKYIQDRTELLKTHETAIME